ncbi:hypothetical protein FPQ18DRAFT_393607 [Pyronema domesticum]|nr:hypothetical protein FPQ18DRAFT_393607 [Pyronema domesticum]
MKIPILTSISSSCLAISLLSLLTTVDASSRILRSTSLSTCQDLHGITAKLFNVSFTPDDGQLKIRINGASQVVGEVKARVTVLAYGFKVISQEIDPCNTPGLQTMCPMSLQDLDLNFQQTIAKDAVDRIPSIAYQIPNLDGVARLEVINKTNSVVACVEAPLSNGQTVLHPAVGWTSALIFLFILFISIILSGRGYPGIAAHLGAHAAVLFSYFQSVGMIAMISVPLPPLVSAWTGNFVWTLGIVRVDFWQKVLHWYIQATGGTPQSLFKKQEVVSVQIAKRGLEVAELVRRYAEGDYTLSRAAAYGFDPIYDSIPEPSHRLFKRTNRDATLDASSSTGIIKVTGIARMAYLAKIESTNIFMTGLSFFVALLFATVVIVVGFRLCLGGKGRDGNWMELKRNWRVVLKGAVLKLFWMALPMIVLLAPYELSHVTSPATATLAVFFLLSSLGLIFLATFRILRLPTSQLILDPEVWAKYGGVYGIFLSPASEPDRSKASDALRNSEVAGFNAAAGNEKPRSHHRLSKSPTPSSPITKLRGPSFLLLLLPFLLLKPLFIAVLQSHGLTLVILLLLLDFFFLLSVGIIKPFLDRRISMLVITIATIGVVNAILSLFWGLGSSGDGGAGAGGAKVPDYVRGVAGVVFVIVNVVWLVVGLVMGVVAGVRGVLRRRGEGEKGGECYWDEGFGGGCGGGREWEE